MPHGDANLKKLALMEVDLQVKADGVTHLVVLPLYPQFSISTSGSSLRLLEAMLDSDPALMGLKHSVIASWFALPMS